MPENILGMMGVQPELRRAMGDAGSLAVPFATPVNAVASTATIAAADIAVTNVGDVVLFGGLTLTKVAANPAAGEWDTVAALVAEINALGAWNAAVDVADCDITAAVRGVVGDGAVATVRILEDTTANGAAAVNADATIAAATIARLANGDTVTFDGSVFTKAAATSVPAGEFADQAGLIACIDAMDDWGAVDNAGAIDIEAAVVGAEFNDFDVIVSLFRVTAGGVNGTPAFAGAVCADAGFIYVCTATDTTVANNNWERAAIAAF